MLSEKENELNDKLSEKEKEFNDKLSEKAILID